MKSEYVKKTLTVLVLSLLVAPMVSIQASAAKPLPTPPFWFECTAGYEVHTDIFVLSSKTGRVGLLGIDAYHVHASSFGSNYGLVIYYLIDLSDPSNVYVEPIALCASKFIPLFIEYPHLSVSRKGLTITANNLPESLPPGYILLGTLPLHVEVTAKPNLSKPEKIPLEFQTIQLDVIIVTFDGMWCAAHTLTELQYFVFNVRVTIA